MVPSVAHHILPVVQTSVRRIRVINVNLSSNSGPTSIGRLYQVDHLKFELPELELGNVALALLDRCEKVFKRYQYDGNVICRASDGSTLENCVHSLAAHLVVVWSVVVFAFSGALQLLLAVFWCHYFLPNRVHNVFILQLVENAVTAQNYKVVFCLVNSEKRYVRVCNNDFWVAE